MASERVARFSRTSDMRVPHFSRVLREVGPCHKLSPKSWLSVTYAFFHRHYDAFVPRNLKRYYRAGHLHFITCSCCQRQPWLGLPKRRDLFLHVLEQMRQRYEFVVLGYVVMPEHVHLLISEPGRGTPSTVMQAVKLSFARQMLGQETKLREQDFPCIPGSGVFMISMCGARRSEWRSCAIYAPEPGEARAGPRARSMAVE